MNFSFYFFVLQLCFLLVSAYLVRNCYSVCACFRAGASTFQVLARYDSVRARHDSVDAYFFPARTRYDTARARLYSVRARLYYARARLYSVRTRLYTARARVYSVRACLYSARARLHSVHARQSTSRFRPRLSHKHPRPSNIRRCTRKYRLRPWLFVCARRRTVRALERPVRAGINAFAPEGSRETTAACARGTISPRPFATTQCPKPLHLGLQLRKQLLARYVVGEDKS
jgi:hypothetical protein